MRYLLIIIVVIICSFEVFAEEYPSDFLKQQQYEIRQQDKLFNINNNEQSDMDNARMYSDLSQLPYYPVIKLDFFNIFHTEYYKDKKFTYVLKNISVRDKTVLGIRLRMSVGYSY